MFGRAWRQQIKIFMDINISAIKDLLDRYLLGNASPAEQKMVEEWLTENEFPDNEWRKWMTKAGRCG